MKRIAVIVSLFVVLGLALSILMPMVALAAPVRPQHPNGGRSALVYIGASCSRGQVKIGGFVVAGSRLLDLSPRFTINLTLNGQPAPWMSKQLTASITSFHHTVRLPFGPTKIKYLYEVLTSEGIKTSGGGHLTCLGL